MSVFNYELDKDSGKTNPKARKLPDDYKLLAIRRGFSWLGPEVSNAHEKTKWMCTNHHVWQANYNNIKTGKGCPYCVGVAKRTRDDYMLLAKERGIQWVGKYPKNVTTKTTWECENGHQWNAPYTRIQQGIGCPYCAGVNPKSSADFEKLAKKHGVKWIGTKPVGARKKTEWECPKGHRWLIDFGSIERGHGCPVCSGNARKTAKDYEELAKSLGFKWLGNSVKNARTKTEWQCSKKHQWWATHDSLQRGNGCPYCSGKMKKNEKDYHELARARGFTWIGPMVKTVNTKTGWKCENGHYWQAVYSAIQQGNGCPICVDMVQGARVSKVQRKLHKILGGELNKRIERYNIDVALNVDGCNIAIEYDSWYWHKNTQKKDDVRTKKLLSLGWGVLRIKSNMKLPEVNELNKTIFQLISGESYVEIELSDWGVD